MQESRANMLDLYTDHETYDSVLPQVIPNSSIHLRAFTQYHCRRTEGRKAICGYQPSKDQTYLCIDLPSKIVML